MPALGLALALALGASACGSADEEPTGSAPARPTATRPSENVNPTNHEDFRPIAGGVSWHADEPLVFVRPSNEMRVAEYRVRDHQAATLAVSHFPAAQGGGGDVAANVERWTGQFQAPAAGAADIARREIDGLPVTTVDVRGTFVGRLGMGGGGPPQQDWRLLGAIVEGDEGLVFFKLLGPEAGVAEAEPAFRDLVESLHRE